MIKKESQIFVGGYWGSGTRVIQLILKEAGYFLGDPIGKENLDYYPLNCLKLNLVSGYTRDGENMQDILKKVFGYWWGQHDKWSLKYPFLMFSGNYLKEIFPDSKFILIVRNGIDNILNQHLTDRDIESIVMPINLKEKDVLLRKIKFWNFAYRLAVEDQKLAKKDYYILRLEDLVNAPVVEIDKMFKFLNIKADATKCSKVVETPKSIGRRNNQMTLIQGEKTIFYNPKLDYDRLYEEGAEMLDYFNYKKF